MSNCRKEFFDWKEGTVIPDYLKAVSWCDGDLPQIQLLTDPDMLTKYHKHNIFMNKQHAATSGTTQHCDLTTIFRLMNRKVREYTVSDTSEENHPLKRLIKDKLFMLFQKRVINLK